MITHRPALAGAFTGFVPAVLAGLSILLITGCASTSISKAPAGSGGQQKSSSAQNATTGAVGTTFTVKTTNDNGSPVTYDVTLIKVSQHARPDSSFDNAPGGKHLAGTEFKITGQAGSDSDDANSDATVQGSDQQTYTFGFENLAAGTNFNDGDFSISPGQTIKGWVSFEIPNGVTVASVQWDASGGFDTPATWTVSAATSSSGNGLTPGQAAFVAAVRSWVSAQGETNNTKSATIAKIGREICTDRSNGISQSAEDKTVKGVQRAFSMTEGQFVRDAERNICPAYLP
jgi:hypothetical protein